MKPLLALLTLTACCHQPTWEHATITNKSHYCERAVNVEFTGASGSWWELVTLTGNPHYDRQVQVGYTYQIRRCDGTPVEKTSKDLIPISRHE